VRQLTRVSLVMLGSWESSAGLLCKKRSGAPVTLGVGKKHLVPEKRKRGRQILMGVAGRQGEAGGTTEVGPKIEAGEFYYNLSTFPHGGRDAG